MKQEKAKIRIIRSSTGISSNFQKKKATGTDGSVY